jgi:hypothetical protein
VLADAAPRSADDAALSRVRTLIRSQELLLLLVVVALASGTFINLGVLAPLPMALMLSGMLLLLSVPLANRDTPADTRSWVAVVGVTGAVGVLYGVVSAEELGLMLLLCLSALAMVAAAAPRVRVAALAIGVAALFLGITSVWQWGRSNLDVFVSLQRAAAALLSGHNPYGVSFRAVDMTGPNSSVLVPIHFQYLPGAAIIAAPGRLLGDVRSMSLLFSGLLIIAGVYLAAQSPEGTTRAWRIAGLSLALPLTLVMVHFGWVDVYGLAAFAGWVALRRRHPRWAVACLAASFTVKPTILVAVVPFFLWSSRARRETVVAALLAALLILPFALITGVGAFYQDVIGIQTQLGFWYGSLTIGAAWYALTGHLLSPLVGPIAGCLVALFVLRRRPADLGDALLQGAALSTAAFLLSKWAFVNYYYLPVSLLVLALAGRGIPLEAEAAAIRIPLQVPSLPLASRRRRSVSSAPMKAMASKTGTPAGRPRTAT